ncbi:MAG: DMT family transporter [Burkholderiales bacterium]|nr:DMT family transporter [Burkholderiales bacterium]
MASQNPPAHLTVGIGAALGAGLMWGLVFVAPLLLPDYPATLLSFGRYLAFGLITLPIAWWQRDALRALTPADWWLATKLSIAGNFIYYLALSASIQLAGAPLPTLIIGTLPVVIAVTSNLLSVGEHRFSWGRLLPSLLLIAAGLLCVNADQMARLRADGSLSAYASGALLALVANAAWTWYPIHNARWLNAHRQHTSTTWATAQGIATLPIAAVGLALSLSWLRATGDARFAQSLSGPEPLKFWLLMISIGFCASWLGTILWNIASKNTPTALTGQLIVFETLAALAYAYLVYQRTPSAYEMAGIALLVLGVLVGVRALSRPAPRME